MLSVAESEAVKYRDAWADQRYRMKAHGLELWQRERHIFPDVVTTALDIGCGHGRLMGRWCDEGIDAYGIDIVDGRDVAVRERYGDRLTVCPIWDYDPDRHFDLAVAADVLEHIPEEMVPQSLDRIANCTWVLIAQTAEFDSHFLGHDLHPTQRPFEWWRDQMLALGGEVTRLPHNGAGRKHLLRWDLR